MRYHVLLVEYNRDIEARKLADGLLRALAADRGYTFEPLEVAKKMAIAYVGSSPTPSPTEPPYGDVAKQILEVLERRDPTPNKMYMQWLGRMYASGTVKFEDLNRRGLLTRYHQYKIKRKIKPEHADINRFKSYADFEDVVSQTYPDLDDDKPLQDRGEYTEIVKNDEGRVVHLKDRTAACFWGQGTKWCTAGRENNMFDQYHEDGELLVFIPAKAAHPGEKYQLLIPEDTTGEWQLMDELDDPARPSLIRTRFPKALAVASARFPRLKKKVAFAPKADVEWGMRRTVQIGRPAVDKVLDMYAGEGAYAGKVGDVSDDERASVAHTRQVMEKVWATTYDEIVDDDTDDGIDAMLGPGSIIRNLMEVYIDRFTALAPYAWTDDDVGRLLSNTPIPRSLRTDVINAMSDAWRETPWLARTASVAEALTWDDRKRITALIKPLGSNVPISQAVAHLQRKGLRNVTAADLRRLPNWRMVGNNLRPERVYFDDDVELAEASPTLPPVAPGHMRLYRGDSTKIDAYDTSKTSDAGLFGRGIYLTNNTRIANDYRTKGGTSDVVMSFSGFKTKAAVKDRYVQRLARYTGLDGKPDPYGHEVPFSSGQSWDIHDNSNPVQQKERPIRLAHAERKWNDLMKTHDVRFNVDGSATIQKKQKLSTTGFAVFDIPEAYVRRVIDAEAEIDERVLGVILDTLRRHGDRATASDITDFVYERTRGEEADGFRPTYRDIYTNIGIDSPLRSDATVIASYIDDLRDLRYNGIEYAGGVTMGGGVKHRAFVFWDADEINAFRVR